MLDRWKSFPTPNPWFEPREPHPFTRWFEASARAVLLLGWGLYVGGCVLALTAQSITGVFAPYVNYGLIGIFLGILTLGAGLPLYRVAVLRGIVERREIIPALTDARGVAWWWWLFVFVPIVVLSLGVGLVGAILMGVERYGKWQIRVHYVCGGKRRRSAMLVSRQSPAELLDDEVVWITRPRLFVPPVPVDRFGVTGRLDHSTLEARDWLWRAFDRFAVRVQRRRTIHRRARALRNLRRERGRDARYERNSA